MDAEVYPYQRSEAIRPRDQGEAVGQIARSFKVNPSTISRLAV
jgi:hypothetical protein